MIKKLQKRTRVLWILTALAPPLLGTEAPLFADAPLPVIVQKYAAALKTTRAFSVSASLLHAKAPDTATLFLRKPDTLVLTSQATGLKTTLVCDGKTLRQWDSKRLATAPAPNSLDQLDAPLPLGIAADLAASLLTDPTTITADPNLKDAGKATVDGVPAEKIVSNSDAGNYTFWLASKTGLPVRAEFKGHHDYIVALRYAKTDTGPATSFLVPSPPAGLVAYTPPKPPALLTDGTPAPDFSLSTADSSQNLSLSSLTGKVVLIDFWASWCPPCKMSMPHIQRIYRDLAPKGLTVLSVNTWDDKAAMTAFLAKHPWYTTTMLFDPNGGMSGHREQSVAYNLYHVSGIPTVYVIDKDGKVAASFVGYEPDDEAKIRAALAKLGVE